MLTLADRTFRMSVWIFLRLLGLCLLSAFFSLDRQALGLFGHNGISPADVTLRDFAASRNRLAPLLKPTIFWFCPSDDFLAAACRIGELSSLCCMLGVFSGPALFCCYILYVSFLNVGGAFLQFQWDFMLVQAALLGAFLRPWQKLEPKPTEPSFEYSSVMLNLIRAVFCQVMFCSGAAKLLSGCPLWREMNALVFYYQDQLLPTVFAWYAHQLPRAVHMVGTGLTLVIELGAPVCFFLPARLRNWAGVILCLLQLCFMVAGNHGFINVLTIALGASMIDDQFLSGLLPPRVARAWPGFKGSPPFQLPAALRTGVAPAAVGLFIAVLLVETYLSIAMFLVPTYALSTVARLFSAWGMGGRYGLYPWVYARRTEILIEGSSDGVHWQPYILPYQINDVNRAPPMVTIYQPRLDWRMRFAATSHRPPEWFSGLMRSLLAGSPPVCSLFAGNPFASRPPAYVRANLFEYTFTDAAERAQTKCWWKRRFIRPYVEPMSAI